ncbi:MAG: M48 family metalloprotease [Planctomycetia bacterium]|nr:MAG: M48 family metalloprotease [Planctomycetia bacterium]RIK71158.1 MAG: hypothetical protein DCC66_03065 [Planctomycetota bacterium]
MHFLIILAFALVLSGNLPVAELQLFKGGASLSDPLPAVLPAMACVVFSFGAALAARRWLNSAMHPDAGHAEVCAARLSHAVFGLSLLHGVLLCALLLATPWPRFVRGPLGLDRWPLADELVMLAPFFASVLFQWIVFFPVERAIRHVALRQADVADDSRTHGTEPDVALGAYLLDKCRHQILVVAAPMILIVFVKHFTELLKPIQSDGTFQPSPLFRTWLPVKLHAYAADALLGIASFFILLCSPVLIRHIWSTRPLPDGPLRRRFVETCRRIGLRYREILLWQTHGTTINAAVVGFVPPMRYILVSDALLENLDDEEIEAVFGHEAGHVHHWHLPLFGVFALVTMYLAGGAFIALQRMRWVTDPALLEFISLAVLLALWLFAFGWLSRKFERQADLFGVQCVTPDIASCVPHCRVHGKSPAPGVCTTAANVFGRTLTRIADLNGIARDAPSWRHGSIASRCRLLESFLNSPAALARFERQLVGIKVGLIGAAVVGTMIAGWIYLPFVSDAWTTTKRVPINKTSAATVPTAPGSGAGRPSTPHPSNPISPTYPDPPRNTTPPAPSPETH